MAVLLRKTPHVAVRTIHPQRGADGNQMSEVRPLHEGKRRPYVPKNPSRRKVDGAQDVPLEFREEAVARDRRTSSEPLATPLPNDAAIPWIEDQDAMLSGNGGVGSLCKDFVCDLRNERSTP